jgi:O-antigen ligase
MGFVLTILYLVTAYLGPEALFGSLAAAHIELILAGLVVFVSLPVLPASFIGKTPQSLALVGLAFTVLVSVLLTGWAGGASQAFLAFIPNAFAYFLVCLHCNTKKRLQVLVFMMLFVCLFVIAHGYVDLLHGVTTSDYLFAQKSDAGEWFYRLKGQDFISDPNDFAQVIVCVIPLLFIFWRPRRTIRNIACVIVPLCVLLYGAFLTHSRGSVLAILAMTVVAFRRRVGTVVSVLLAVGLFFAASALQYTGGREISADAGSGRMDAWAFGLQLMISHPLFGVGFGRFTEYYFITAHNSIVVCAAELGLIGLFFWSLFLFPTMRDVLAIASPEKVSEGEPIVPEKGLFPQLPGTHEELDKAEINRLGRLGILSLTGFLVTSWFLSRAYSMTLFLLGGIVEVFFEMALKRGMIAPRMALARVMRFSVVLTFSLVALVYIVLRSGNLMR